MNLTFEEFCGPLPGWFPRPLSASLPACFPLGPLRFGAVAQVQPPRERGREASLKPPRRPASYLQLGRSCAPGAPCPSPVCSVFPSGALSIPRGPPRSGPRALSRSLGCSSAPRFSPSGPRCAATTTPVIPHRWSRGPGVVGLVVAAPHLGAEAAHSFPGAPPPGRSAPPLRFLGCAHPGASPPSRSSDPPSQPRRDPQPDSRARGRLPFVRLLRRARLPLQAGLPGPRPPAPRDGPRRTHRLGCAVGSEPGRRRGRAALRSRRLRLASPASGNQGRERGGAGRGRAAALRPASPAPRARRPGAPGEGTGRGRRAPGGAKRRPLLRAPRPAIAGRARPRRSCERLLLPPLSRCWQRTNSRGDEVTVKASLSL
uniref:uncharacterized protein LOC114604401 n=1 Tax=Podarcis muralis TaxID=64176 RepID=UPI0010A07F73|nr:uncharacterized protein LOC114604401 [Podarcis muralis]